MDNRTTPLADGVWLVEVAPFLNTLVVANDGRSDAEGLTVVDSGTRSGGPRLVRSVRMLGFDPTAVRDLLLTHWHRDHAGSAARFADSSARTRVWCSAGDLPVVRGTSAPPPPGAGDSTRLGRLAARLFQPAEPVPGAHALEATGTGPWPAFDGSGVAGGLQVVPAAGHTRGHLAVHLPDRGVLHAGDALFNVSGLRSTPGFLASDLSAQPATLRRLAALEFDVLSVAHGQPVTRAAGPRLRRVAERAES